MHYTRLRLNDDPARLDADLTWDKTSWEDFFDPDWDDEEPPFGSELGDLADGEK